MFLYISLKNWISYVRTLVHFHQSHQPKTPRQDEPDFTKPWCCGTTDGYQLGILLYYMSKKGIDKLRKLNPNHPDDRPFSLICNEISMISQVGSVGNQNYRTLNKIFPGPFTAILDSNRQLSKRLGEKRQTWGSCTE